jgi:drug/metabolite transporter (DMT)-like permease
MRTRVLTALIAASIGWGMAGVGSRYLIIEGVSTLTVVVVRTLTATAAILVVGAASGARVGRSAWRDGTIIGVLRIGISPMLFISSLRFISAGVESIFITLIPALTATLAAVFLHERLGRDRIIGLLIGLVGTTLIVGSGESGIGGGAGDVKTGALLALGGVVVGAASGVFSRKFAPRHRTTDLAVPMFVSGSVVTLVAGLALQDIELEGVAALSWVILVALGLGSTFLPFFATLFAARHVRAAVVSLTGYTAPIVGVAAGVVLLDEVLTVAIVIGAILALVGVVVVGRGSRRPVPSRREPGVLEQAYDADGQRNQV